MQAVLANFSHVFVVQKICRKRKLQDVVVVVVVVVVAAVI